MTSTFTLIWRMAQRCGFSEVKLGVLQGPPFYLSLQEYEDFLAGGADDRTVADVSPRVRARRPAVLSIQGGLGRGVTVDPSAVFPARLT